MLFDHFDQAAGLASFDGEDHKEHRRASRPLLTQTRTCMHIFGACRSGMYL
jgi:hypothetical protein